MLLAGLEQAGRMRSKETVLVTAAAGGTGQFAVQLAKLAGNTVVATCGSDDKAQLLTDLGCDRVINYNKEQTKVRLATWPAAEPRLSSASIQAPVMHRRQCAQLPG